MKKFITTAFVIGLMILASVIVTADYSVKDLTSGNSLEYITSNNEYRLGNHLSVLEGYLDTSSMNSSGLTLKLKNSNGYGFGITDEANGGFFVTPTFGTVSVYNGAGNGSTMTFGDINTMINGGTIRWNGYYQTFTLYNDFGNELIKFSDGQFEIFENKSSNVQIGTKDAYSRNQIWDRQINSVLRLGSLGQDGDSGDIPSEGMVIYGAKSTQPMDSSNWSYTRIKPNRFGIYQSSDSWAGYTWRVDDTEMYMKNDSGTETFGVDRNTGEIRTNGNVGLTDTSSFWMCNDINCSTSCQVNIQNGLIISCI